MESEPEACGICLEVPEDLRMLPCFHVACMTCILGMTQTGQGRAVTCHICREPCLFESIRSLPRPVRCEMCKNLVKNPKKFPCCDRPSCSICVKEAAGNCGLVFCPNNCGEKFYKVEELSSALICRICFRLNTDPVAKCAHAVCLKCQLSQAMELRECRLCSAIGNPLPIPVNPMQTVSRHENFVYGDVMQRQSQQLYEMQTQSAYQILAQHIQRNIAIQHSFYQHHHHQHPQEQQLFGVSYSQNEFKKDRKKAVIFVTILLVFGSFFGLSGWLWIAGGVSLLIMRQNSVFILIELNTLNALLWALSFFRYFWLALGTWIFVFSIASCIVFLRSKCHAPNVLVVFLHFSVELAYFCFCCQYMSSIFWHIFAVRLVSLPVEEYVKRKAEAIEDSVGENSDDD